MIRSMYAAVSSLRAHQEMINVTGNNIANVNTTGFKKSQTVFQDILGQTLQGASMPTEVLGGTNPAQIGLGVRLAAVAKNMGQGAISRTTGRVLDLAIEGDGFFVMQQAGQSLFSRNGSLFLDGEGRLVGVQGGFIQGWQANGVGQVDTTMPTGTVRIPLGDQQPQRTSRVELGGNLPADSNEVMHTGFNSYDSQGNATSVQLSFTKSAANTWTVTGNHGGTALTFDDDQMVFGNDGALTSGTTIRATYGPGPTDFYDLTLGGQDATRRVAQYAGQGSVAAVSQDGAPTGTLQSISIGQDGVIFGAYSNGRNRSIGQIALATFANPEGLEQVGGTNFRPSANSGLAQIGTVGTGGRGLLLSNTLEGSNVDLAEEFTELIRGQRGFQANSRVITTSDELLQEVVNLKR